MYKFILEIAFTIIAKMALLSIDFIYFIYSIKARKRIKSKILSVQYLDYKYNYNNIPENARALVDVNYKDSSKGLFARLKNKHINKPVDKGEEMTPEDIKKFLAPLPIGRIWGIGKVTREKLHTLGLSTIEQLQQCDFQQLEKEIGLRAAQGFSQLAQGLDEREITLETEDKSISNETTFNEDTTDRDLIEATCKGLIDKVGARLRKAGFWGSTVHLKIRWNDFSTITRQIRCAIPCCDDITLREIGMGLLQEHLRNRPVRLIGFGISGLTSTDQIQPTQLNLFESPDTTLQEKRRRLSHVTDDINQKYGTQSILRASAIENKDPS